MIKFFRKIRQQLLTEKKLIRYLLYAIGEIVLVVIGILIALAINNQNENRKELKAEKVILKQLKGEYESNLIQLENKISQRNKLMAQSAEILEIISSSIEIHSDSLSKRFATFLQDPTFDPIQNDLISSGNIRLIKNDSLKTMLSHWSSDLKAHHETEQVQHNHMVSDIIPFLKRKRLMRNATYEFWNNTEFQTGLIDKGKNSSIQSAGRSSENLDISDILEDPELEGLLSYIYHISKINNLEAFSLKNKMELIIELQNKEINSE